MTQTPWPDVIRHDAEDACSMIHSLSVWQPLCVCVLLLDGSLFSRLLFGMHCPLISVPSHEFSVSEQPIAVDAQIAKVQRIMSAFSFSGL